MNTFKARLDKFISFTESRSKVELTNNWLIYSDFFWWLDIVPHNGLDTEVYDLRPADYTTTTTTTTSERRIMA